MWTVSSSLSIRVHHGAEFTGHSFLMNNLLSCWLPAHYRPTVLLLLHYHTSWGKPGIVMSISSVARKWSIIASFFIVFVIGGVFRKFCCQLLSDSSKLITDAVSTGVSCIISMMARGSMLTSKLLSDLITHLGYTLLRLHLMWISWATYSPTRVGCSHIEYL